MNYDNQVLGIFIGKIHRVKHNQNPIFPLLTQVQEGFKFHSCNFFQYYYPYNTITYGNLNNASSTAPITFTFTTITIRMRITIQQPTRMIFLYMQFEKLTQPDTWNQSESEITIIDLL
jgi:hypothetical protein